MIPIEFEEQNLVLGKPPNMTDEECVSLPCYSGENQIISKWMLTPEEVEHVLNHGYIWVRVYGGVTSPPILPQAVETVFEDKNV